MTGTILIIEDQSDVRENITELLELAGHRVLQAHNGIVGIRLAKAHLPDLLLCDIMMPELDGYGVAEVLSRQPETAHIPLIFLTARAEREDFRKGLSKGAVDYITKPFQSHELLETIEMRLKREIPSRPHPAGRAGWLNWLGSLQSDHPVTLKGTLLHVQTAERQSTLFTEGDLSRQLYFLRSGLVRLDRLDSRGKRLCIHIVKPGQFFGWSAEFEHGIHLQDAVSIAPIQYLALPQSDVREGLMERPELAIELCGLLLTQQAEFESTALSMAYGTARENTARALLRFAVQEPEGWVIPLSREDLANSVGMAAESVIRTLAAFKKEGLVETQGRLVRILDADALEDELG
ncbi:MAG: hypothetical protein RJA19_1882 [Bacteroidota bacterium]